VDGPTLRSGLRSFQSLRFASLTRPLAATLDQMSSSIIFYKNEINASSGIVEDILGKIVKTADCDSKVLNWAVTEYRAAYSGCSVWLDDILDDKNEWNGWEKAVSRALDICAGLWGSGGIDWIRKHRMPLKKIYLPNSEWILVDAWKCEKCGKITSKADQQCKNCFQWNLVE
jgi:hypothetical protein